MSEAPSREAQRPKRPRIEGDMGEEVVRILWTNYAKDLESYCDSLSARLADLEARVEAWKELAELAQRNLTAQVIENELHEARAKLKSLGELP